jgi:GDPmannose 4,6-dehydratase
MTQRRALILGATGQDGAYLARHLLTRGYAVYGGTRDAEHPRTANLEYVGVRADVTLCNGVLDSVAAATRLLEQVRPDEIYNLAGQTSVAESFQQPRDAYLSFVLPITNLLESLRLTELRARLFNAGSGECFGNTLSPATEKTPFCPLSPYAAAKVAAHHLVSVYRQSFDIHACTGFLYAHESPLRPPHFVARKIVSAVRRILAGDTAPLVLGNLDVQRDWGWAPDYVDAMHRILQCDEAQDFIIATGESHSLREFVELAFHCVGLDCSRFLRTEATLRRPTDIGLSRADPRKAMQILEWRAVTRFAELVPRLVRDERTHSA